MPCSPCSESLAEQDVDGWNRQPLSGVLTVQIRVGIFVSVLKKGSLGNRVRPGSLSVLSPKR